MNNSMPKRTEPKAPLKEFTESEWFKSRPPAIQEVARHWPPGVYRFIDAGDKTGMEGLLFCYEEDDDGKCTSVKLRLPSQKIVSVCIKHLEPVDVLE